MTVSSQARGRVRARPYKSDLAIPLKRGRYRYACSLVAGWITTRGFSPEYDHFLSIVGVSLFLLVLTTSSGVRQAAISGILFGLGLYVPAMAWLYAGVDRSSSWALALLAPSLLIAGLILQPGILAVGYALFRHRRMVALFFVVPSLAVGGEWLRQHGELPFPWLNLGYSQIPGGLLAGFAPLGGVLAVSWSTWVAGAALALTVFRSRRLAGSLLLLTVLLIGHLGARHAWTQPLGAPISVGLLQGNVKSEGKFDKQSVSEVIGRYEALTRAATGSQLVVMPETAWPIFNSDITDALEERTRAYAVANQGDILVSHLQLDIQDKRRYYNVARSLGVSGTQVYFKRQLVPFGEYIPYPSVFQALYRKITKVNLLDTSPGLTEQSPMVLAGHRVAMRLCYEDLFGGAHHEELATAAFIVGLVNDDWFGSLQPLHQHLQVAQARALESGKPFLRAANTGITAVIQHTGHVTQFLPAEQAGVLKTKLQPRAGVTPYALFGDLPVLILAGASSLAAVASRGSSKEAA